MTRRPPPPSPPPKPRQKLPRKPVASGEPPAEQLADTPIRPLLERYCDLAGVRVLRRGPDLHELKLPPVERVHFKDRAALRLALSLDALERNPDAEIAVLGSPFLAHLIAAIRTRGGRLSLGLIPPPASPSRSGGTKEVGPGTDLVVPVRDGTARTRKAGLAEHAIGRLFARVVLRAGATVEEAVVESDVFDLATGTRVSDDVADLFRDLEAGRVAPAASDAIPDAVTVPSREPQELLRLLLANLREKSAERVRARQAAAEQQVAAELERLDRYFASILADKTDADEVRTITALHERRRTEEVRRHQVKAIVHPLQLVEARVLVQRVEWELESAHGRRARFAGQRPFAGAATWTLACPRCARPPAVLVICRHEEAHCVCDACALRCSVCAEDFCADHGIAMCRVDDQPACAEHARVCQSCRMEHCSTHAGVCAEGDHPACSACLEACGSCGRVVCNRHAERSRSDAPKGSRRLCPACLRYCEGGTNEPVGVDEVTPCASCDKSVCTAHQAVCEVDGHVHCSRHLRRTDHSQRLVCKQHLAACVHDGAAVFASDEVQACPICGKDACARHRVACEYCGRHVCTADLAPLQRARPSRRCSTCAQLAAVSEPPEPVLTAALTAIGGGKERKSSRAWRMARDRSHLVVELDFGLTRKTVLTVRHGDTVPDSIVKHSLLGSKGRK
ncbi:MAG TPA: hypothetical protein VGU74_00140 [Gemmatimonadales bacterium]|nr:hypothetical protein [Gemmatimonadales bacterium]